MIWMVLLLVVSSQLTQVTAQVPVIRAGNKRHKPIELRFLDVSVMVVENIATTTMEMKFYNGNNRVMEGELNFPLSEGVTVSRFALDVNGEMREGVVVEKEKATQAFEAVTRRRVDPGLVEVTRGNNFKARVYPIPARGYKKAIIAFEQELKGDGKDYIYRLPLKVENRLEEFSVKVEVMMQRPSVRESDHPAINLDFKEERISYIAEYSEKDVLIDKHLAFSVPKTEQVSEVITYRGNVTSDNYFYINLPMNGEVRIKEKPGSIAVVWDESSSGKNRDIDKEISILAGYLEWMVVGTVRLITFSNVLHKEKRFAVSNGSCRGLMEYLRNIQYDGGTNLGAVDFRSIAADEVLLFSDGISTFGAKSHFAFRSPVFAINSSNSANHSLLEYIASSSHGIYANASELQEDEVVDLLTHQPRRFIKAEFDPNSIKAFYPEAGHAVSGDFSCAGKVEGAGTVVTLHFGFGGEITESHRIAIDNTRSVESELGERVWAQKKLKRLLVLDDHTAIVAHGKEYRLVTPGTSLIVLDNVEDYVNYGIVPPASLLEEYSRITELRNRKRSDEQQFRKQRICSMFEADYQWWETVQVLDEKPPGETGPPFRPPARIAEVLAIEEDVEMEDVVFEAEAVEEEVVFFMAGNADMEVVQEMDGYFHSRETGEGPVRIPEMKVKAWESDASYMGNLKATDREDLYGKYLSLKPEYGESQSFYFDVATYMFQKSLRKEGLRVISNLAELELEDVELMRALGRKLSEFSFYDEAIAVFSKVMKMRSFEPHSYMDLGLTYAETGAYQEAVDHLYTVIDKQWDTDILSRFPGIELIVLHEINNIIHHHGEGLDIGFIDPCFINHMPVDLRVVIDWDANETDMDLWVTDPRKETCNYQNKNTRIGGRISNDMTQGYGPEEFRLKDAVNGTYSIVVKFYGSRKQTVLREVTVRAFVFTNFGSEKEQKQILTLQLEPVRRGEYTVGEVEFEKAY